jgi:hypothetical protein
VGWPLHAGVRPGQGKVGAPASSAVPMSRFFGNAKPAAPKATLADANATMEKRGESLDTKIQKLDSELFRYTEQVCWLAHRRRSRCAA